MRSARRGVVPALVGFMARREGTDRPLAGSPFTRPPEGLSCSTS
jgi:hypothetical protein